MAQGKIKAPFAKSLFWRISLVFMLLLLTVGILYIVITAYTARLYFQETNQRLNAGVAKQILKSTEPFDENGEVNDQALKQLFEKVMFINPSIEVYLLNKEGNILSYFAPNRDVKIKHLPLEPIQTFIKQEDKALIKGTDPKAPDQKTVFSAAPIKKNDKLKGYLYVILASKDYQSITNLLLGSYILKGGSIAFLVTLGLAIVIGLGLLWLITRYTQKIIDHVNRFKEGDYQTRIPVRSEDEMGQLAASFNEMADTIETNIHQIKEMENARKELIANVSHDLRTPLANLTGYVETLSLKGRQLDPEQKDRYLNIMFQNANRLKHLVDELFELSKLESGQIEPHREPFFINEMVQDITNKYQLSEASNHVQIKPIIPNSLPPVYADVSMIDRVIQNLIDNAIKFTPEQGILTLELTQHQESVEVKVSDTGPGIPESEQPQIFNRYRKSYNDKHQSKGSGLGLAIVKNMLEIQGISIHINSKPAQGTAFYFYLPYYQNKAQSGSG